MAKAFLSHSSYDKDFVREVANRLGRQHCVFDERTFATGEEFKEEIERALDDSYVFVFFVSKASLDSVWVRFELKEAWYHSLQGTLKKSLVYVLDDGITIDDLPDWMRRFRVRWNLSVEMVFDDIRQQLHELSSEEIRSIFIGRFEESAEFQRVLLSYDDPQRVFFVTGLPGIGRRSLIKKVARDSVVSLLSVGGEGNKHEMQKLLDGPDVIGKSGSHGWGTLLPTCLF